MRLQQRCECDSESEGFPDICVKHIQDDREGDKEARGHRRVAIKKRVATAVWLRGGRFCGAFALSERSKSGNDHKTGRIRQSHNYE